MTPEQLRILFDGYPPPEPAPKRPNQEQLSALFAPIESFGEPIKKATPSTSKKVMSLKDKRETPTQKAKQEVMTAVQKARRNIKLLEYADKLAISKIKAPQNQKYKNVLRKQEEQLHHYLKQYADPNYLPKAITKEYEFPKYFYYTVNSKKGIAHKRTRTDSAMFAKFMNSPEKKQQAELQGLFNKPLSIKTKKPAPASMPSPVKTVEKKKPSLEIMPFEGEELIEDMPSYAPIKKNITLRKKEASIDEGELALLEEYIEEAEQEAKLAKAEAKKAQDHAKDATEKVKILKTAMGDSGAPLIFKKIPLDMTSKNAPATPSKGKILRMITNAKGEEVPLMEWEEDKKPLIDIINNPNIIRRKARVYDSDDEAAATRALERYFNLDEEKAPAPKKKK